MKATHVTIYGRPGCPFCVRAKQFAEGIGTTNPKFTHEYVDIWEKDISLNQISETIGKPVRTVPQIFADESYVGGCDDFEKWLMKNDLF